MQVIAIKPLSVNECWQGRRFKTDKYKAYETALFSILPKLTIPPAPYQIHLEFGFSSAASDWDNPVKPFQDILQKHYKFNDKQIKRAIVDVVKVPKGSEYVKFNIASFEPSLVISA